MNLELLVYSLSILHLELLHAIIFLLIYLCFVFIRLYYKVEFAFELKLFLILSLVCFAWIGVEKNSYSTIVKNLELRNTKSRTLILDTDKQLVDEHMRKRRID